MRNTLFAAAAVLAVATQAAHAQQSSPAPMDAALHGHSVTALEALAKDWNKIGFMPPSKPGQFRVYGRYGYVTDGAGYNRMVSLIRAATRDAGAGRDTDAMVKVAQVRSLLTRAD